MNAEPSLEILTVIVGFLLKVTFAFGVFWGINRFVRRANQRFVLWLSFLAGAGLFWIWNLRAFLGQARVHQAVQSARPEQISTAIAWNVLKIPGAWASPLDLVTRPMAYAYFLVLFCFLISFVRKSMHLRWVIGFTSKPPDEISRTFHSLAEQIGVRSCRLLMLSGITSPATIGWIRPTVLLPSLCCERDTEETEDILRHELHHIRRNDYLLCRIAGIFEVLLFFHPLVWYANRQLELERELACDFAVVSDSPQRRLKYAECLVSYARLNEPYREKAWGVDFASAAAHLKTRLHTILQAPKHQPGRVSYRGIAAIVILITIFLKVLPALTLAFAYARTKAPQLTPVMTHVARSHQRIRIASARKTPPILIENPSSTIPALDVTPVNMDAVSIPQEATTSPAPIVRYGSPTPNEIDREVIPTPEPPNGQASSPPPRVGSKGRHVKMPTVTSFLTSALMEAGRRAAGGRDSGANQQGENFR